MADTKTDTKTSNEDVLSTARKRFQGILAAQYDIRAASLEDIRFAYNVDDGQWDEEDRQNRIKEKRPCLTFNKLRKFVAQVANQERENRMAVKAVPVDDKADIKTAEIIGDLMRQVEYLSKADEVYAKAGENAIAGGFGYWRILTAYTDNSFDQEITIEHIENPFSVYYDPRGNYCFIREGMTLDEFKTAYPKAEQSNFDYSGQGEQYTLWYENDKTFVAEYFVKEPVDRVLIEVVPMTTNPTTGMLESAGDPKVFEVPDNISIPELEAQGFVVLRRRKIKTHKVMWYKITGAEILESQEWPGKEIPVIEVVGDEVNIEGKIYKRSLIRDAKDAQRMYNYWATSMTEKVALVPKAPFLVTPRQIQGFETQWNEANIKNFPYLTYNPEGGPAPQRQAPAQIDSGAMSMLQLSDSDIKDTVGMYEPTIGDVSNERSGRAIQVRNLRSATGVYHFPDNLRRAILHTSRILIDLIPRIYNTERYVRLRSYEGEERIEQINFPVRDLDTGNTVILNDLTVGRYDVRADVGIYSTRRQETLQTMLQAMQYAPQIAPALAPLLFKYMDAPGASEIVQAIQNFINRTALQGSEGTPPAGGELPPPFKGATTPTGGAM